MKKLTEEDLQELNGAGWVSCAGQVLSVWSTMGGAAYGLALGSGPIGWTIVGIGAVSTIIGIAADPYACGD